jgi:hypothetical protein
VNLILGLFLIASPLLSDFMTIPALTWSTALSGGLMVLLSGSVLLTTDRSKVAETIDGAALPMS